MGLNLTILSMFGVVALTGVVVNDSLALVDFINRKRRDEVSLATAVREAGRARFSPDSAHVPHDFARADAAHDGKEPPGSFPDPDGRLLAFGVLFATFISLLIVPCIYLIVDDVKRVIATLRGEREAVEHEAFDQTMVS